MTFTRALSTNNYGPAKFIVDGTTPANGTHTTIAAALTSASSGDTIFIRPGTYTENLTLKAGVNLTSFGSDGYSQNTANASNVTILGKATATFVGSCSIYGICLKTNADFVLVVSGSSATNVNLINCYIFLNNNTGISYTSSSASSKIQLFYCKTDTATTGITLFASSSAGVLKIFQSIIENNGASVTVSTCSAGAINIYNSFFAHPITTSSTGALLGNNTDFIQALIFNGTGTNSISNCSIAGGTSSAVSVGTGVSLNISSTSIDSTNTNAISGAGTLRYSGISFTNTSSIINTTTQTANYMNLGKSNASGQPAFLAYLASDQLTKTGNGASYALGTNALTEVYDQDNNFVTSGTFTAPVTGRYHLGANIFCTNQSTAAFWQLYLVTSNRTYITQDGFNATAQNFSCNGSIFADMDAADTFTVTITGGGEASNRWTMSSQTNGGTNMYGYMEC